MSERLNLEAIKNILDKHLRINCEEVGECDAFMTGKENATKELGSLLQRERREAVMEYHGEVVKAFESEFMTLTLKEYVEASKSALARLTGEGKERK